MADSVDDILDRADALARLTPSTNIPWINSKSDNSGSLWDSLRLGGTLFPGLWSCSAHKKRQLDIVKVRRLDGVRILDNGYFGVGLSCMGTFWQKSQWDRFQQILPDFDPQRAGGGRSPLDCYHPAAALLGVGTVYIVEFGVSKPERGMLQIPLELLQWFPKPKIFVQGFAGADDNAHHAAAPLAAPEFAVDPPSNHTADAMNDDPIAGFR